MTGSKLATIARWLGVGTSAGALLLLIETAASLRASVWWLDRTVLSQARFSGYLWTAVAVAIGFLVQGVLAVRPNGEKPFVQVAHGAFGIVVVASLIVVAHGWRIRTDVAPPNAVSSMSDLPFTIRLLADPYRFGFLLLAFTAMAVYGVIRRWPRDGRREMP